MQSIDRRFSREAVRAQVARIVASEGFIRCRRMQRFLEYVVEETLALRSAELGEYAIGTAVFDRGEDFEPALDPIVRNDARRLRLKLAEYYREARESENGVRIEIPKGGYVPVFASMTQRREQQEAAAPRACRLAVMPLEVISVAQETWTFARALCLSLTALLTNANGFETLAHSYLENVSVREAASELRASHVLQGSLLQFGEDHRVILNLIQVSDGTQVWAGHYDFDGNEAWSVQSEIAGEVLNQVKARLGNQPAVRHMAMAA